MSDNLTEKESQLCHTIRQRFLVKGGVYDDIKCQLQHQLVEMMRGNGNENGDRRKGINQDTRTLLVNQLIMEYLHWHGLNYSAKMFAMETRMERESNYHPNRELLEMALGKFQKKEIPILLEMVLNLSKKASQTSSAAQEQVLSVRESK